MNLCEENRCICQAALHRLHLTGLLDAQNEVACFSRFAGERVDLLELPSS